MKLKIEDIKKNYIVTSNGSVISKRSKFKILSEQVDKYGYKRVHLSINGVKSKINTHRLVALYFIDNPENKPQVNHKDGNKLNNHVDNLEWCTAKENITHAYENGLAKVKQQNGELNKMAKLTWEDVDFIRTSNKQKKELAKTYNVTVDTIYNVLNKKTWVKN